MISASFAQISGFKLSSTGFSNFAHPLDQSFFSIDPLYFIHQICLKAFPEETNFSTLKRSTFNSLCDIKTRIPLKDFIQIISEGPYSYLTITNERLVHENAFTKKNISLLQNSQNELTRTFWAYLSGIYDPKEFKKSMIHSIFLQDNPEFRNYLLRVSWDYAIEKTTQFKATGLIRKIRNENTNRVQPIYSETEESLVQWTLVLLDSYELTEHEKVQPQEIDPLTCRKVFGPYWREPTYEEITRYYKELLSTKIFDFVKGNEIWLADSIEMSDGESLKKVYLLDKKSFPITNHKKRIKAVPKDYYAYRVCLCSTARNKIECAF